MISPLAFILLIFGFKGLIVYLSYDILFAQRNTYVVVQVP